MEMKRILVFCRHGADVESFFEELSSSMKELINQKNRFVQNMKFLNLSILTVVEPMD